MMNEKIHVFVKKDTVFSIRTGMLLLGYVLRIRYVYL
jgi:hypothetical protein